MNGFGFVRRLSVLMWINDLAIGELALNGQLPNEYKGDRIQDVVSVLGPLVLPTKTTWIAANLLNCQSRKVHLSRAAYAVVIARTLSGSIRIPNTRTAEKTAVKARISPSLTSRR